MKLAVAEVSVGQTAVTGNWTTVHIDTVLFKSRSKYVHDQISGKQKLKRKLRPEAKELSTKEAIQLES